jgi:hypothetical protein
MIIWFKKYIMYKRKKLELIRITWFEKLIWKIDLKNWFEKLRGKNWFDEKEKFDKYDLRNMIW